MAKATVNQIVTERVIKALEEGRIPWRQPWASAKHQNLFYRKPYNGVNRILCSMAGFASPYWATANQMKKAGIRWAGKGTPITYWHGIGSKEEEKDEDGNPKKTYFFLRYFYAWNLEQMSIPEGLEIPALKGLKGEALEIDPTADLETASGIMSRFNVRHSRSDKACYTPATDTITLPVLEQFRTICDYYGVAFHEAAHATGHPTRLDRKQSTSFGSSDYAFEELIAEISAGFALGKCRMNLDLENIAAYCQGWATTLGKNHSYIVKAASQAEKALAWMLGETEEKEIAEEEAEVV